jgi:hypothetical protein
MTLRDSTKCVKPRREGAVAGRHRSYGAMEKAPSANGEKIASMRY